MDIRAWLARAIAAAAFFGWTAIAAAQALPPVVETALQRARLPADAVVVVVADAAGQLPPRVMHRAEVPVNPASLAKLVTTFAGLELLGPAFSWSTPVYIDGVVQPDGRLDGNLYLRGQGDPRLVSERLWSLLRRVQGLGIRHIAGDIVLDRSAFDIPPQDPAAFDGEPLRPYNAAPDALLVNFRAGLLHFTPVGSVARVQLDPPMAGLQVPASVPLAPGACNDWRTALKADFSDAAQLRFGGAYPAACGARVWPVASGDPAGHAGRTIAALWTEMGGQLAGRVRDGRVPPGLVPVFEFESPPLAEVVRDINKYSNNVMAQQLYLTLALRQRGTGTYEAARELVGQWWRQRIGGEPPTLANGSGLSRTDRASAAQLARLLQVAWASPLMPELMASLPLAGTDGTARRTGGRAAGLAHLKTGSLRDVAGIAGYVHAASGRRWVVVAIANGPQAGAFRLAMDVLVDWVARQ